MEEGRWMHEPGKWSFNEKGLSLTTEPGTDLWQRTYYGFRIANAPLYLWEGENNFTFTVKVKFDYKVRYDQCGVMLFINDENWFKASIEYENRHFSRLGSVVTNRGYSDWATTDIPTINEVWYRLSRRGPDFLLEYSQDGKQFQQMRVFHLSLLGETTEEMGKISPELMDVNPVSFGIYACSPEDSAFTAEFTSMSLEKSTWMIHS